MVNELAGSIHAITGLASILLGLFLTYSSTQGRSLERVLFRGPFPVFIAGLLFLFNGFGLFASGAMWFSSSDLYVYWKAVSYGDFYPITHPLILLFALYYPRPLNATFAKTRVRKALILTLGSMIIILLALSLFNKEYYETINLGFMYYFGIFVSWIVFIYWYRLGSITQQERMCLALLLVGFLFGPMNRWWVLYVGSNDATAADVMLWWFEYLAAVTVAGYLMFTSYARLGRLERHSPEAAMEKMVIAVLSIPLVLALFHSFYVKNINIDPYDLGFGLVRPLCFSIAILKFRMFKINLTRSVVLYTSITLMVGFLVFQMEEFFQSTAAKGAATVLLMSVLFLPVSALARFTADVLSPRLEERMERFFGPSGEEDAREPMDLGSHLKHVFTMKRLAMAVPLVITVELLEMGLSSVMSYPPLLSALFLGILFSSIDYLLDVGAQPNDELVSAEVF